MEIRTATASDTEEIARIYAASFPSADKAHADWCSEVQPNARRSFDDILLATEQGRVLGTLTLYRQAAYVAGAPIGCGGIGSLAVLPDFRMKGVATRLMDSAFVRMRALQLPLSLLYPFKQSFYQKLGYGLISEMNALTLPSSAIPRYSERDNVHPFIEHELTQLIACYDAYAKRSSFCLERPAAAWKDDMTHARRRRWSYWCHHSDEGITGYMLIEEREEVTVRELVYLTPAALRGLLGFLAVYKTQRPLLIPSSRDEFIHLLMMDPQDPSGRALFGLYPFSGRFGYGLMMRVLNVREALRQRRFGRTMGSVTFHILDDRIRHNTGTVSLAFKGGAAHVSDEISSNLISLTIPTFAQLYSGYLPFSAAVRTGLIDAFFDTSFLDEAFALPMPRCLDFF